MVRKSIHLLLCIALAAASVSCSGSGQAAPTSKEAANESETVAASEDADGDITDAGDAADAPAVADAGEAADVPNSTAPNAAATDEEYDAMYAFVNVKQDGNKMIVIPNGTVNDDTVLYNNKTLGPLCDYIDSTVLEDGRTINRNFLYGLVSVQIVDPQLMSSYEQFSRSMMYCLTIANEFHSTDVTLVDLVLDSTDNTRQVFDVIAEGKEDSWILDGHEYKFYLNGGNTEYESTMFDPETLAIWSIVLDEYFEESSS